MSRNRREATRCAISASRFGSCRGRHFRASTSGLQYAGQETAGKAMRERAGEVPADSTAVAGSYECCSPAGVAYRFELCRLRDERRAGNDVFVRLRCFRREGRGWVHLPMKLALRSKLWDSWFTTWPPVNLTRVDFRVEEPFIEFHDAIVWEAPVLPFYLDTESVWRAQYSSRTSRWSLTRVRRVGSKEPSTILSL